MCTKYTVTCLPETANPLDLDTWSINVEWRGFSWAIRWFGRCLSTSGEWDLEMIPSSRSEEWLAEHRFTDLAAALRLAEHHAPLIKVNGRCPADITD